MQRSRTTILDRLLFGPNDEAGATFNLGVIAPGFTKTRATLASSTDKIALGHVTQLVSEPSADDTVIPDSSQRPKIPEHYCRFHEIEADSGEYARSYSRSAQLDPSMLWQPRILQLRPLAGLAALATVVGCIFASLAILVCSNGNPVPSWPVQPTVYLAAVTAVANSALVLARMEAEPVSWWFSATRGRTISALERQWQITRSFIQAVRFSRYLSILNIACIAGALVVLDGPCLQRASSVKRANDQSSVLLTVTLPPELPTGFTGAYDGRIVSETTAERELVPDYLDKVPMRLNSRGCKSSCETSVHAPGVIISNCTTSTWPISPEMMRSRSATWGPWKYDLGNTSYLPLFYISILPVSELLSTGEAAVVSTGRAELSSSGGIFIEKTCLALPAILQYKINVEGDVVTLPHLPTQGALIALANNTIVPEHGDLSPAPDSGRLPGLWRRTTMDGITVSALTLMHTNVSLSYSIDARKWTLDSTSGFNAEIFKYRDLDAHDPGGWAFVDPTSDIISTLNELMFRGATKAAFWSNVTQLMDAGVSVDQEVPALMIQNVFHSDFRWYGAATLLEILAVISTLPMFWGWWTLGTKLTLSPLSLALAFDSPLLNNVNSAGGSKGVVQEIGGTQIKFGTVCPTDQQARYARLGFARSEVVIGPSAGTEFCQ